MNMRKLLEAMTKFVGEPGDQEGNQLVNESILKDLSKGPRANTLEEELAQAFAQFNEDNLGVEPKRPGRKSDRPVREYTKHGKPSKLYTPVDENLEKHYVMAYNRARGISSVVKKDGMEEYHPSKEAALARVAQLNARTYSPHVYYTYGGNNAVNEYANSDAEEAEMYDRDPDFHKYADLQEVDEGFAQDSADIQRSLSAAATDRVLQKYQDDPELSAIAKFMSRNNWTAQAIDDTMQGRGKFDIDWWKNTMAKNLPETKHKPKDAAVYESIESADPVEGAVLAAVQELIQQGHTEVAPEVITNMVVAATSQPFLLKDLVDCNNKSAAVQHYVNSINPAKVKFSNEILTVKNEDPLKDKKAAQAGVSNMAARAASRNRLGEGKVVPVITAFRQGMERIINSDMAPDAKQAAFEKLSAEFHRNAETYSQAVKAKKKTDTTLNQVEATQSTSPMGENEEPIQYVDGAVTGTVPGDHQRKQTIKYSNGADTATIEPNKDGWLVTMNWQGDVDRVQFTSGAKAQQYLEDYGFDLLDDLTNEEHLDELHIIRPRTDVVKGSKVNHGMLGTGTAERIEPMFTWFRADSDDRLYRVGHNSVSPISLTADTTAKTAEKITGDQSEIISGFRKELEDLKASNRTSAEKQAIYSYLVSKFTKQAAEYSQNRKTKVEEYGTVGAVGTTGTVGAVTSSAASATPAKPNPAATQALATVKSATSNTAPVQTIAKALDSASQGTAVSSQDMKALEPMMKDVATIAQDPKLANQFKSLALQANQTQKQQQK